jgi:hypothetical protein
VPTTTLFSRRSGQWIATGLLVGLALAGCSSNDADTVTVVHPPVPAPTVLAVEEGTSSVGDVRLWNFDGTTADGDAVIMDWIMTTTAVGVPGDGLETRFTTGVFSFDDGDQLILEGVAHYPSAGSTLEVSASTERAIVGGTGAYAGARGSVESIHFDDDTWEHIFTLD